MKYEIRNKQFVLIVRHQFESHEHAWLWLYNNKPNTDATEYSIVPVAGSAGL